MNNKQTKTNGNGNGNHTKSRVAHILEVRKHEISTWRIFKIMSELVDGFEMLASHPGKVVTVFGSARATLEDSIYRQATSLSSKLAKDGYTVITGGGGGVMEAANRGAYEVGGSSVGLNIKLPREQAINHYVTESQTFHYFFTRKVMLSLASSVYIYFPGGFGTLDELFEMLTLIQTKKIPLTPIILVGKKFWTPMVEWIKTTMVKENKTITKEEFTLFSLVDSVDEAYALIQKYEPYFEEKLEAFVGT